LGALFTLVRVLTRHNRTKHLIEDYTEDVVNQLEYLADTEFEEMTEQSKLEFFSDTRQVSPLMGVHVIDVPEFRQHGSIAARWSDVWYPSSRV
jgi:hypothetical protein